VKADLAGHRDELIVSTKAGYLMWPGPYGEWGSRKYLLASLDQSLKRMGLDYVDIFYSHRVDPETPLEETMGALDSAVRQGKRLLLFRRQDCGSRRHIAPPRHAMPDSSAVLFDVQSMDRERTSGRPRRGRHWLHRLLAARAGAADRQIPEWRSERLARE
jgi:hypothetical protein